jgi:hypothetical protein
VVVDIRGTSGPRTNYRRTTLAPVVLRRLKKKERIIKISMLTYLTLIVVTTGLIIYTVVSWDTFGEEGKQDAFQKGWEMDQYMALIGLIVGDVIFIYCLIMGWGYD